ncbi:amidase family protein [Mollisia scopiformis]|uniref:Amidase family protein n=1 Tax=Mollisia scopiformis TaxID=149040 RepID=A0A194XNM7_MOLSC|nr:amidase family protein [Mollisia scopiformis]KUJ21855.1 amidase family protein [Mollisia scopiformis]
MAINPLTATAAELQAKLTDNSITSQHLVKIYLDQIARHNGSLKAVIATVPEKLLEKAAAELDNERASGTVRGPLHGIPFLVKDNIATIPELGVPTTCDSGWSAVGGQTQSAYVRGGFRDDDTGGGHSNPGGSSSGSAVAVAAGFCPISIGTETTGSLIMPADRSALYTIKPTVKLIPQDGIIPISFEADSAGPMTKSVLDLANLLDILVDPSKTTIPEGGYKSAVTGSWDGIRVGWVEPETWLFPHEIVKYEKDVTDQMLRDWRSAYKQLTSLAEVVKTVKIVSLEEATAGGDMDIWNAFHHKFKPLLEEYLAGIDDCKICTLEDLVKFNEEHAEEELSAGANYNQAGLLRALNYNMTDDQYHKILQYARKACGPSGIDKALEENGVDVIIGPGDGPLFNLVGGAGYPVASLPLGYSDFNGRPFGLQVFAKAHQEALLVRVQSAWEANFPKRQPPDLKTINPLLV